VSDSDSPKPTSPEAEPAESPFQVAVEEEAAWKRRLTVTVAPQHVRSARQREQKKLARRVKIKGFRKGKIPPRVIEERFGPTIDQEVLSSLLQEGFREAIRARELHPISDPVVGDVQYQAGESLTFQVEVEVMPELQLARVGGFRIERPEVSVGDDEVDEILERMRADHAILEPVDRQAEDGEVVSVLIRHPDEDDDEEEEEEEEEEDRKPYRFELGAGLAIPDVEDAIRSLEPGNEGTFEVTYPDDFDTPELAGTTRELRIELLDVKTKRLPELDDDLAREVGDFDSLDALRAAVTEDLVKHREREAEDVVRERLIDSMIEANAFEVPPSLVERYLDRVIEAPDDAPADEVEKARRTLGPAVERQIKRDLILERLIDSEGLAVSEAEVEERLQTLGERGGLSPAEVRKRLAREKRLDALRQQIATDKAFDFLASQSTIE
jgi:trigger factor